MVKIWSKYGQNMVKIWSKYGQRLDPPFERWKRWKRWKFSY
jgi:hypothetical protein